MPTSPAGDMACAQSPMQSKPSRDQQRRRLIWTVSILIFVLVVFDAFECIVSSLRCMALPLIFALLQHAAMCAGELRRGQTFGSSDALRFPDRYHQPGLLTR
jgi:hypothetical protein